MRFDVSKIIDFYRDRLQKTLNDILINHDNDTNAQPAFLRLLESLRYGLFSSSAKRLRPLLVYAIGETMRAPLSLLDIPAAAIELIHTASLVHDDLPALDNDDYRRGKPTCHKTFDESTAILAGNAMQMLACEILSESTNPLSDTQKTKCIHLLTTEFGINGLMQGQMLDLHALNKTVKLKDLETVYRLKTACLIKTALFLGAIVGNCRDSAIFETLTEFSNYIGLAYQIQDDILDMEIDHEKKSNAINMTYPLIVGVDQSKEKVKSLYEYALGLLQQLPGDIKLLEAITKYMIFRIY